MVGRCLGIDFGERRIGLAISDERNRVAVPLTVLERRNDDDAVTEIRDLAARENVARLVLGDPLGVDGTAGDAARRARSFARKLARATALPVEMVPETLTSVDAERRLQASPRLRGGRRRSDRPAVDAVAAQILLQEALDRGGLDTADGDR